MESNPDALLTSDKLRTLDQLMCSISEITKLHHPFYLSGAIDYISALTAKIPEPENTFQVALVTAVVETFGDLDRFITSNTPELKAKLIGEIQKQFSTPETATVLHAELDQYIQRLYLANEHMYFEPSYSEYLLESKSCHQGNLPFHVLGRQMHMSYLMSKQGKDLLSIFFEPEALELLLTCPNQYWFYCCAKESFRDQINLSMSGMCESFFPITAAVVKNLFGNLKNRNPHLTNQDISTWTKEQLAIGLKDRCILIQYEGNHRPTLRHGGTEKMTFVFNPLFQGQAAQ